MKPEIEVFVFLDALGWDLVGAGDWMKDLLPHRRAVEMQFGYSCTAIPTILSGATPAEHGHLSLFRFDPKGSPFKGIARLMRCLRPASFWTRGRVRNQLSKFVKRRLGFTGYFQLYQMSADRLGFMDYGEKRNLFVPGGMAPLANLADACARSGVPYHITDWRQGEAAAFPAAEAALRAGARFLFVYAADLDAIRHDEALNPNSPRVAAKLADYRRRLESLAATLAATGRTGRLTVFSDHGMTPLVRTIDLKSAVERTGLVFGVDYGCCYDSTLFRVTYLKPAARARIEQALAPFACDGHWLTEDEERRYGIYRADRFFGDAIFLVNPGVQIVPSDMTLRPLNGMHGYEPTEAHSLAAILSTDAIPPAVTHVRDSFGLMTTALKRLRETA